MVQLVPTLNEKRDLKLVECSENSSKDALAQARALKKYLWLVLCGTTQIG